MATHDSFVALGIGSVVPELRQPVPRMLIAPGVIATGLVFRASWPAARRSSAGVHSSILPASEGEWLRLAHAADTLVFSQTFPIVPNA